MAISPVDVERSAAGFVGGQVACALLREASIQAQPPSEQARLRAEDRQNSSAYFVAMLIFCLRVFWVMGWLG
jgi:hypothetical protein